MSRMLLKCLAVMGMLWAGSAAAQVPPMPLMPMGDSTKEGIDIGTSTSEIAITPDFRGADLTVFGTLSNVDNLLLATGHYDIVVTLQGPRSDATVRRKERVFGIWVNRHSMTFEHVPESYSLASTRPIDVIATPQVLNDLGLGSQFMRLTPMGYFNAANSLGEFRDAYRRLKVGNGLYQSDTSGVRFVSSNLFRATLRLPVNIPDGVHIVNAYLFKTGSFVAERELALRVVKTGLEESITRAAHENALAYGFLSVLLAVITGWGASLIFRRD